MYYVQYDIKYYLVKTIDDAGILLSPNQMFLSIHYLSLRGLIRKETMRFGWDIGFV